MDEKISALKEDGVKFSRGKGNRSIPDVNPKRGRGSDKIPVVGIVERNGNVVAEVMKDLTYSNLKEMVKKYVDEDNAVLVTDEYKGYNSMKKIIEHIKIDHSKLYSYRGVNTNSIESFWAIVERGIMGQYHSVSPKMLPNYVAEFVYKYNNRKDNEAMFHELLEKMLKPNSL
jgi:transposase-like protein